MQFVNTRSLDNQKKEKLNRKQNMRYLSVNKNLPLDPMKIKRNQEQNTKASRSKT